MERLHHRLLCSDSLDDRVRAESVGQLLDPLDPVAAGFLDDVVAPSSRARRAGPFPGGRSLQPAETVRPPGRSQPEHDGDEGGDGSRDRQLEEAEGEAGGDGGGRREGEGEGLLRHRRLT